LQKAETNALDAQAKKVEDEKPKPIKLLEIAVDVNNMVYVNWPTDKRELCVTALCEALKLVASYEKPLIIKPKPSIIDFIRGVKK
jgi:hypothetical protein